MKDDASLHTYLTTLISIFQLMSFLHCWKSPKWCLSTKKNLKFTANIKCHCYQLLKRLWKYWCITESGNNVAIWILFTPFNLVFDITRLKLYEIREITINGWNNAFLQGSKIFQLIITIFIMLLWNIATQGPVWSKW